MSLHSRRIVGLARRRVQAGWARLLREDRGASPLELAIVAPAVLLLMLGVLQACLVFHARSLALAAAQQGCDAGRAYNAPAAAGRARTAAFLDTAAKGTLTATTVTVTNSATTTTVTVTGNALTLLPGVKVRVSQSATAPREIFVP